jgi:hypothetical protein
MAVNGKWLGFGVGGLFCGLILLAFSPPGSMLAHLALVLCIAAPVTAFWRALKPKLAPHCPRPPEPGWPK